MYGLYELSSFLCSEKFLQASLSDWYKWKYWTQSSCINCLTSHVVKKSTKWVILYGKRGPPGHIVYECWQNVNSVESGYCIIASLLNHQTLVGVSTLCHASKQPEHIS